MKYFYLLLLLVPSFVAADIYVVVNANSAVGKLELDDVTDLYLGRKKVLGTLYVNQVLDRHGEGRQRFFYRVAKMEESQVNAYWAKLKFSGRMRAPENIHSNEELLIKLQENPQAIGYMLEPPSLDSGVKVVLKIDE